MAKSTTSRIETAGATPALIEKFEKGLQQLHKGRWSVAEKTFSQVLASDSTSSLAQRARLYGGICVERQSVEAATGAEDAYLTAVIAKNRGDLDASMSRCDRGGLKGRDPRFAYLAAAVEALRGNNDDAARLLAKAIEMEPANRVHAFWDPDFDELRDDPEHAALFDTSS